LRKIFGKIGFAWFAIIFAGTFLLLYPLFFVLLSRPSWYPLANRLRRIWAWTAVLLTFSFPKIVRVQNKFPKKCIFVANHTSYLDIVVLGLFAPTKMSFIGKRELANIPLFGIFFRTVDIAVKRESMKDAHKAFHQAKEKLDAGYSILIFPEGTIWNKTPELKEFKNGAFKMAIETKLPIVPVTFYNNYKVLPDEKTEYYPSIIKCKIHRAIETDHLNIDDANQLKDEIYNLIRTDLIKNHVIHENNQ
jgi:1-acyl-sn-glycerol-3-phosphate acyltransferase